MDTEQSHTGVYSDDHDEHQGDTGHQVRCRALSNLKAEGGSRSESPWDQELEGTVARCGRTV